MEKIDWLNRNTTLVATDRIDYKKPEKQGNYFNDCCKNLGERDTKIFLA